MKVKLDQSQVLEKTDFFFCYHRHRRTILQRIEAALWFWSIYRNDFNHFPLQTGWLQPGDSNKFAALPLDQGRREFWSLSQWTGGTASLQTYLESSNWMDAPVSGGSNPAELNRNALVKPSIAELGPVGSTRGRDAPWSPWDPGSADRY